MLPTRKILIYFGVSNIFILIFLIIIFSYIDVNEGNSNDIIHSNYKSVDYSKNITKILFDIYNIHSNYFFNPIFKINDEQYSGLQNNFQKYINAQENNITERGEKEITHELKIKYEKYIKLFDSLYRLNNYNQKLYFNKILPLQNELVVLSNNIFTTNYFALISGNEDLVSKMINVIISMIIFVELLLIIILFRLSKFSLKKNNSIIKNNKKRDYENYPKYWEKNQI